MYERASDVELLKRLGGRLRAARLAKEVTQDDLAREAGVGLATLQRMEDGQGTSVKNLIRVLRALGLVDRLEDLVPEVRPGPIAQLNAREATRRRGRRRSSG
ncbi:MAG: helix-turn-helix domain-containing protein [Actinomycetota bacterium]|nr:helix-turn-helix domain-containing protein [Actinomycetota bacterium]